MLFSCCRSIWLPMALMTRSNSWVRSAWNVFHCRQLRKMMSAANGLPLLKPRSSAGQRQVSLSAGHRAGKIWMYGQAAAERPEMQDSRRSWSAERCSRSRCCCLLYSSRCRLSMSDSGPPSTPSGVPPPSVLRRADTGVRGW